MNITLTPEIERVLSDLAEKQGTTIEMLALNASRTFIFQGNKTFEKTNEAAGRSKAPG